MKWKCRSIDCDLQSDSEMVLLDHRMRVHGDVYSVEKVISTNCKDNKFKDKVIALARELEK